MGQFSNPKRIGIDCRMFSSSFTGIGRYVYELTKIISELDKSNQYFLFFNDPQFSLFTPPSPNFHPILVNAKPYSFSEQIKFNGILNKQNLDLMHFTHFNAPILYRKPFIVTIHDLTLHFFPGKKMTGLFRRLAYLATIKSVTENSRAIISVSTYTRNDLISHLKISPEKIQVIYEGVSTELLCETPESPQTFLNKHQIKSPYLLYTGVWKDHKNLPNLLRAFAIIKKHHSENLQLVITGTHNRLYAKPLLKLANSLNLTHSLNPNQNPLNHPDLIFPGHVSENELATLFTNAKLFVFPSFYEGFGLPPLESMAFGLPVAASSASCIPEICSNAAHYFNPHSPEDMAEKITQLLTNPTLRVELIHAGKKNLQRFSWHSMATQTLNLYQSILSSSQSI